MTCNALEWVYSFGGGVIIEPDKKVTINNPKAIKALETAKELGAERFPRPGLSPTVKKRPETFGRPVTPRSCGIGLMPMPWARIRKVRSPANLT